MTQSMKNLVSPKGERHGIIKTVANSAKGDPFKNMSPETKAKAEKLKKDDERLVKVRYHNYDGPNERLTKPYLRWADQHIDTWHLIPGEVYQVPYGFVKEVNDPRTHRPTRSDLLDQNGVPLPKDGAPRKVHELLPAEF